jgi:alkylhydroperoxidase family enzyme
MADRGNPTEQRPLARWRARWGRLSPLSRDISLVLVAKLAALGLLWWVFFSHPAPRQSVVDSPRVAAHLATASNPEPSAHADR